MGAGVVYRSGLENLAGNTQETAEMADLCGSQDAPEALFADCSAAGDGNKVGTRSLFQVLIDGAHSFIARRGGAMPGVVYFIQSGDSGPVKIGYTKSLGARLCELKVFAPEALTVLATVPGDHGFERHFHFSFEKERTQGEWFTASPRLLAVCDEFRARYGEPVIGKANRRKRK